MAQDPKIQADPERGRARFDTLVSVFNHDFSTGIGEENRKGVYLNLELLHCAVNAYFDDIERFKAYAGSEYADRHKQAAYTIKWLSRFKPIQIVEGTRMSKFLLTVNEAFALFAGFMFLDDCVARNIDRNLYDHLIYTLTYRRISGKDLSTMMYLIERACG